MFFRRLFLFSIFLSLTLLALWLIPLGRTEREFTELRKQDQWQLCDFKREDDRLFVLRLYNRISPVLTFLRSRENERLRNEFHFRMIVDSRSIKHPDSYYWDDLRKQALQISNIFNLRHWIYWESEINELLEWDRDRIAHRFVPGKKLLTFFPSDAVQRVGKYDFQVLLNPGDFEPAKDAFQNTLESYWSYPPYNLKVVWSYSPKAYKFIFDPFGRSNHVDREQRKIYLTEKITDGTLTHEIGHLLGFADHYRVSWNEKNCQVVGSTYLRDVMSNSSYKRPLLGHWLLLEKAYPARPAKVKDRQFSYQQSEVFFKDGETVLAKAETILDSVPRLQRPPIKDLIPKK